MERGCFHGYRCSSIASSTDRVLPDLKLRDIKMKLSSSEVNNNGSNNNSSTPPQDNNDCIVREQDRFMPIANVIRIMRKTLPSHAKISDDAKETVQECVSEYISFITGEANDRCQREQRKTITAEDVLWAMSKLGFDDYIEPLTLYLHRYRDMDGAAVKRPSDVDFGTQLGFAFGPAAFHMAHHVAAIGGCVKDKAASGGVVAGGSGGESTGKWKV